MRPRSKLLSKRRLTLPTIREGTEETVRDLNETNALHSRGPAVSSEDYLLSICHLAHPTFATRDATAASLPRPGGTALSTSELNLEPDRKVTDVPPEEEGDAGSAPAFGCSDPLEYLYGRHGDASSLPDGVRKAPAEGRRFVRQHGRGWESRARARAHSVPRASSPDFPRQRKSSCPELHTDAPSAAPSGSPGSESRRVRPAGVESPTSIKQSLISQWISDCRLAWREARVRACMLPAIAEV